MSGPSLADIEAATAAYTGVDLRNPHRYPSLVAARALACQAMRYEGWRVGDIARHWGLDHSTVSHHCAKPVDDDDLLHVINGAAAEHHAAFLKAHG